MRKARGYLLLLLFAIVGYKVIYPAFFDGIISPPTTPFFQSPSQVEYIYITVPAPTPEPLPTYTPYPTQTPLPPQIVFTSKTDEAYRIWMPRILMLSIILLCFWVVYNYYKIRRYAIDLEHEERMAEINAQTEFARSQAAANTPQVRPINFNVHRGSGDESFLVTAFNKKIPHSKVREFVDDADEVGLSINQWRQKGWAQQDIEDLLDHLEVIQLINPRSKGSAATWRREVDKQTLARMLGVQI